MYVREKVIRRGKREYRYFQLVQSTWVEGKSRQTVIQHLGPFGNAKAATKHARVAGYLCGADGCSKEPTQKIRAEEQVRGGKSKAIDVYLCDEHLTEIKVHWLAGLPYDPEKARQTRDAIRKAPAGGRPPFQLQDRDSAMKNTSWD